MIQDIDGATHALIAEYTWAPGGMDRLLYIRSTSWNAVITDPLNGSVRGLANLTNGQPTKQYPASYWGEVASDTGSVVRFRHAGREYDAEVRIYYNRARYYDPQLGRFLSEDPIGIAGALNLYSYAGNDPVNSVDPTGLTMNPCPGGYDWAYIRYYDNNDDGDYDDGDTLIGAICNKIGGGDATLVSGGDGEHHGNPSQLQRTPRAPCDSAGHAMSPAWYESLGKLDAMVREGTRGDLGGTGALGSLWMAQLLPFGQGRVLDAKAQGAGHGYGNYVFGVYFAATGYSLRDALVSANLYGGLSGSYTVDRVMDKTYTNIPTVNVGRITAGYNDQKGGALCSTN